MDEHLLKLPEEFRFRISDAIQSYDQQFNDSTLNQFIDLIFECATSNLDYFEPIYQICKLQVEKESNGNNEGKFLKKFDSHVETLLHDFFENSNSAENCAAASMKVYFLAFLSVQKFWLYDITFDRIKKLMSPVGCNCPEHCYVKDCANGTALRAEELRLKEHSIQCGILYLISITPLLLRNIEYYIYWCSRLRKYKHCFGNGTQDMIGQLETCFGGIDERAHCVLNEIGSLEKTDEQIENDINRLIIEREKNADKKNKLASDVQKKPIQHGTYMRAYDQEWKVDLKHGQPGEWERWYIEDWGGKVVFKAIHSPARYLRACSDGNVDLVGSHPNDCRETLWKPFKNSDETWSFLSVHGTWLSGLGNNVVCCMWECKSSEKFTLPWW
ncbi:unnamed protein product [Caenorhabditis angaria]|uniref:Uncharacterized protein n=1 Tax=Caenorhabditis angaria TaxID=860376 RepID=A0A9P1IUF4_9PELO|nr:unnamed protein product [Caenorhabditis angaria]